MRDVPLESTEPQQSTETGEYNAKPPPSKPTPVGEMERVRSLDVLRGVAVLGILYMNIQSFSMPDPAYGIPVAWGDLTGVNFAVWLFGRLFVEAKFMTMFSMLFGAGILLMAQRLEAKGRRAGFIHYRRMTILLGFGALHSYGLWTGDVLFHYAACGMLAFPLRRFPPTALIALGLGLLVIGSLIVSVMGLGLSMADSAYADLMNWDSVEQTMNTAAQWEAYRGSYSEQLPQRVSESIEMQTFVFFFYMLWRVLGMILIGMGLYKLGVFSAALSARAYATLIALALFVGLPVVALGVWHAFAAEWRGVFVGYHGSMYNYWGSLLVALGWIAAIMLLCRRMDPRDFDAAPSVSAAVFLIGTRARFAAVGRMAFTNYIMQSVICTWIFYGHGLGLYGDVSRVGQLGITAAVWLAQLAYSPLWLHYFSMGPLEWLWRCLTYMRVQPIRRPDPSVAAA